MEHPGLKPRWPKGVSGNPGGRPKSLRSLLPKRFDRDLALRLADRAMKGDRAAMQLMVERLWPALSRTELTGADGDAIHVKAPDLSKLTNDQLDAILDLADQPLEAVEASKGNGSLPH